MPTMANPYHRPMDLGSNDLAHKTRKNKEDKYCGVCGDRALGYNFDAISCESCKAFFRRNAPKGLVSTELPICASIWTDIQIWWSVFVYFPQVQI